MTEEELIRFIDQIRRMCDGDKYRIGSALGTMRSVLTRQHADPSLIKLVSDLNQNYELTDLARPGSGPLSRNDLDGIIRHGRNKRAIDDAHRGCR